MARKSFVPGNLGNTTATPGGATVAPSTSNPGQVILPATIPNKGGPKFPTAKEWTNLVISMILSFGIYYLGFYLLHNYHGVNFLLSSLLGFALGLGALAYIDSVFKTEAGMATPVIILMTLILSYSLAAHYLPDYGKKKPATESNNPSNVFKSESLTFMHSEKLVAHMSFIFGKEYRFTVSGAPVDLVLSSHTENLIQKHGTYTFKSTTSGAIIFEGTGGPSTVKIEWQ